MANGNLNVRLNEQDKERLEKTAEDMDLTSSQIVRRLVKAFLDGKIEIGVTVSNRED